MSTLGLPLPGYAAPDGARTPDAIPGLGLPCGLRPYDVPLEALGKLAAVGRPGGQGRVYRPLDPPAALGPSPLVVKIYRRRPSPTAVHGLIEMIAWGRSLGPGQAGRLRGAAAWPLAVVTDDGRPTGIAMHDVSGRFEVPFVMPSGKRQGVLLSLEHLLGADDYLQLRGLGLRLTTATRVAVAERISGALAFLHRHAIVAGDIAPNNLLLAFARGGPEVCFIDCDSMVFQGRQPLPAVETADWQLPAAFAEPPGTRAADAHKLGLVVLRLLARSHDSREVAPHVRHVPAEIRDPLRRALGADPANRPPAGEWQRALRELLAGGALNERYPGPRPPARLVGATPPRLRPPARLVGATPPGPRPPARPLGVTSPASWRVPPPPRRTPPLGPAPVPAMRPRRAQAPLTLAWLALVLVVLWLAFARLIAAAAPTSSGSGFDTPSANRPASTPQYYDPSQLGR